MRVTICIFGKVLQVASYCGADVARQMKELSFK